MPASRVRMGVVAEEGLAAAVVVGTESASYS